MKEIGTVDTVKITAVIVDDAGYDTEHWGEFGLSLLVEAENPGNRLKLLVDTGLTSEPLLHNMRQLGIDPMTIDKINHINNVYKSNGTKNVSKTAFRGSSSLIVIRSL